MPDPGIEIEDLSDIVKLTAHMAHVREQIWDLSVYVRDQVANKAGFTGLLEPFCNAMDVIDDAGFDLAAGFTTRYTEVIDAVNAAALMIEKTDGNVSERFLPPMDPGSRPGER